MKYNFWQKADEENERVNFLVFYIDAKICKN